MTIYYILSFSFLIATSYKTSLAKFRVTAKVLTSLGFVATAFFCATFTENAKFFYMLLPGFIGCFVGDIFLAIEDNKNDKKFFVLGLLSFLLGHILFAMGLERVAPFSFYQLIAPILSLALAAKLITLKKMDAQGFKPHILVYSFFVAVLFSKGLWVLMASKNIFGLLIFLGGLSFVISDAIILFIYFYKDKFKFSVFFNLLTYYLAMILLAISIYFFKA